MMFVGAIHILYPKSLIFMNGKQTSRHIFRKTDDLAVVLRL